MMRLKIRAYSRKKIAVNTFVKHFTFYKIHIIERAITSQLIIYNWVFNGVKASIL